MTHGSLGRLLQDAMARKNVAVVMSLVRAKCKVSEEPDSCWEWFEPLLVPRTRYAYQQLPNGKQVLVHRVVAWAHDHFPGELRDFPVVHHICTNTNCVNPHHLRPTTPTANQVEGNARAFLVSRAIDLDAAISTAMGNPSVMTREDQKRQVRRRRAKEIYELIKVKGMSVVDACRKFGISDDTYRREIAKFHPELEQRSPTAFEEAISARDGLYLLASIATCSTPFGTNCRKWNGSHRQKFASKGSDSRQWYMARIAVWAARGCPTVLTKLPRLHRNVEVCESLDCINPDHWDPVTDFLHTVKTKIVTDLLAKIRWKTDELTLRDPNNSLLVDGWDSYLATEFRNTLGLTIPVT